MSEFSRQFGNIYRKVTGVKPSGHGPYHEAIGGWVDPKPYIDVYSNGIFEGYDNSVWMYFKFPEDVKVQWNKNPEDAMRNQHFFVNIVNQLSNRLNNLSDNEKGDERRNFHISIARDVFGGIRPHESHTPAMRDYLKRMSDQYSKPVWNGYMGLRLIPTNGLEEAHGIFAKAERWLEMMRNPEDLPAHLYNADRNDVTALMTDHGFQMLDFTTEEGIEDYRRLTAWHGIKDEDFDLNQSLVTTRMKEPLHGASIITQRWGEITMSAVKPAEERFMVDPISSGARWADPIFSPGNDVVCISIRGEIRSKRVANAMFENKYITKKGSNKNPKKMRSHSDADRREMSMLERAQQFAEVGHGMLDNTEIIVGTMVTENRISKLSRALQPYGLTTVPLINRQPIAVNSTFPTYPKPIMPHRRSNRTRPELSNQMYAGILAMSGIFRSTKPNCDRGFLVGLSDGLAEYAEIWTDIEGSAQENATPGFLYTGRPGAGKTQSMLQHLSQNVYNGYRCFYLNPKPSATLRPIFDLIDGNTVSISAQFLSENPGCMDPMFFLADRNSVASLLSDSIYILSEMGSERGTEASRTLSELNAQITDRCLDQRNVCSGDVIFGRADEPNGGIQNMQVREIISNNMRSSPFWRAFISTSRIESKLFKQLRGDGTNRGSATLIEWDKGLTLPSLEDIQAGKRMSPTQIDSIVSVTAAFQYATEIVGQGRAGGGIWIDEAWVMKLSPEMMRKLNAGLREFRERNIFLGMGTQRLVDFLAKGDNNMASYFSRFLIMAISENDEAELDMFFELTGLPRTEENINYILKAGAKKVKNGVRTNETERTIPRAYYIDRIYEYEGGVIMGPWPERELSAGRTDKDAYMRRKASNVGSSGIVDAMGQLGVDFENSQLIAATDDEGIKTVEDAK